MVYERSLKDVENFVFDLDGTVWAWNRLRPGVERTLETLRQNDKNIKFLTNNAILRREQYAEKLRNLGINASTEDVLSGSYIASEALDRQGITSVYVVGEEGLRDELKRNDIQHSEAADDVLISVDRNFSYWKMAEAAELIRDGASVYTTSVDGYWFAGDRRMPGANALTRSIARTADIDSEDVDVLGKPSDHAKDVLRDTWTMRPENTVMIGDNIQSDVVFGNRMGYTTGLVLGATHKEEDVKDVEQFEKPNMVFRSFKRIIMKL